MANLKEVRIRIASVTSTQQITKAMKMVSAAKLKRATNAIVQLRPYANKLREILADVSASVEGSNSPYTVDREPNKVLIIVVSSNRGLAGAFNANAIKTANNLVAEKYADQLRKGDVSIITVGKKGYDFYAKKPAYNIIANHSDLFGALNFENTSKITEFVMEQFKEGNFDRVEVVYNQFRNAAVQILTSEQILPLLPTEDTLSTKEKTAEVDYIIEPSKEKIIEELIPKAIKIQLYKAILDSHASEHGARMTAMDKATDNAGDLLKALKLSYNQARQAAITTELTEIVSGAAALSNG
ncbi:MULTISPECIES: ATP synthase F1 subunit gamma [Sphingobacterium]|jgi:F-type H+-transporting ATPase subunit gamma|uniref:ATP synthase gamma chain n=2 Tax=Sphingobacterium TaxID=28453 RepID=A0ABW5Z2N0_9SPHI|nr:MULTISPECIES: ATP synthase F1 subunit gamma [Sphingobacterium]KKX48785.1 F0F1 ATP synthase subunit gamma [Sphingobacterium sp. IITKGP-BTPF85]MBB2953658.1 F-type H+-transporting ATPase subunit gamma [Sphingobacterium sp. JUb56]MCS3554778.1 F-type H+-transporting ATPase subunit gamma [Sphingobacterium sp. JUb21]MCW2262695.1 F-type H+-transporting ATPase subunit gamma [Sphingobacterium kitahiroshimense]QQD15975.1 ATP synthase F1 subunit gamma [Sphingobacterium sp. UDSM-2020]